MTTTPCCECRDTGIGIDDAMLPRVFDLFVQEPQTLDRSQGGLGLGLAIVRSLVELHGGTVAAFSRARAPARSSRSGCHCVADAVHRPIAGAPSPADVADRSGGTRVLIVDDNEDAATMLGSLLATFGYKTRVVYDAPSALAQAETFEPHMALIDIGLPVMDGFELAQRMLQRPRLQATDWSR